jgi:DNA-directed RNA polymerase specialized sigma54-like protein
MSPGFHQQQKAQGRQTFGMKLAGLLDMPETDCAVLIREMESDPLFIKLSHPSEKCRRAVKYKPFRQTSLSYRFFELQEDRTPGSGAPSAELAAFLAGKEAIINLAKTIGEDRFKSLFLYAEDDLSLQDMADECGLSLDQTQEILDLVNMVGIHGEFSQGAQAHPENSIPYSRIGSIVKNDAGGHDVHFTSAHWARGVYEIDYDRIEEMKKGKFFSREESRGLASLIKNLELINSRKSTIFRILTAILQKQKSYLDTNETNGLIPFLQNELAGELGMHPSSISRAISRKTVETPWGKEMFLKEFFFTERAARKTCDLISEIIRKERTQLKEGVLAHPLGDKEISGILMQEYHQNVAPRTVTKYRKQLEIPNSYRRSV